MNGSDSRILLRRAAEGSRGTVCALSYDATMSIVHVRAVPPSFLVACCSRHHAHFPGAAVFMNLRKMAAKSTNSHATYGFNGMWPGFQRIRRVRYCFFPLSMLAVKVVSPELLRGSAVAAGATMSSDGKRYMDCTYGCLAAEHMCEYQGGARSLESYSVATGSIWSLLADSSTNVLIVSEFSY